MIFHRSNRYLVFGSASGSGLFFVILISFATPNEMKQSEGVRKRKDCLENYLLSLLKNFAYFTDP